MEKILISSCLLGEIVRYDAGKIELRHPLLCRWRAEGRLVAVCPEVEGGLPVPRLPAEICSGDGASVLADLSAVATNDGRDVTRHYLKGARTALRLARRHHIRVAILKENSPSCGVHRIFDGRFQGRKVRGSGVTTTLLENNRIKVFNETEIDAAAAYLASLEASRCYR